MAKTKTKRIKVSDMTPEQLAAHELKNAKRKAWKEDLKVAEQYLLVDEYGLDLGSQIWENMELERKERSRKKSHERKERKKQAFIAKYGTAAWEKAEDERRAKEALKREEKNARLLAELGPEGYRKYKDEENARNYKRKFAIRIWFDYLCHITSCCFCGHNDSDVLQFHHFDRFGKISQANIKTWEIGNMVNRGMSLDVIIDELKKCVPLCSNCHDKLHALERKFIRAKKVNDPNANAFYREHYNKDGSVKLELAEEFYPDGFNFPEFEKNFDITPREDFTGTFDDNFVIEDNDDDDDDDDEDYKYAEIGCS